MVLSQGKEKVRQLRGSFPEAWRMMRESRRLARSMFPISYFLAWFGMIFAGLSRIGSFAVIGVLVQYFLDGSKLNPGQLSVTMVVAAVAGIMAREFLSRILDAWRDLWSNQNKRKIECLLLQQNTAMLLALDVGRLCDPEFIRLQEEATGQAQEAGFKLLERQLSMLKMVVGLCASAGLLLVLDPLFALFAVPMACLRVAADVVDKRRFQVQ